MLGRSRVLLLVVVACVAATGTVAAGAGASAQLSWSAAVRIDRTANAIVALACVSARQCVGIDIAYGTGAGRELTFDPAALRATSPRTLTKGARNATYSVTCARSGQCMLVDGTGREETFTASSGRVLASARIARPHECGVPTCGLTLVGARLDAVACPGAHLCVAGGDAGTEVSFDPTKPRAALQYTLGPGPLAPDLVALACPSAHQCTAIDSVNEFVTFDPASPGNPTQTGLPPGGPGGNVIYALACPTRSQCTAVTYYGDAVTFDPHSPGTPTTIAIDPGVALRGIACPSASLCVAVDAHGRAVAGDPQTGAPWLLIPIAGEGMNALTDVACPSTSRCVTVDSVGRAAVASRPAH